MNFLKFGMQMLLNKKNAPNNLFWISTFCGRFLTKIQPKLTKNEENWQNPNYLITFSVIWYVNASQQKKIQQKNYFGQKTAKIDQKLRKLAKSKPFNEIF